MKLTQCGGLTVAIRGLLDLLERFDTEAPSKRNETNIAVKLFFSESI